MRILLATDGSPHSQAAFDTLLERPWPEGTVVRVLTAAPYPYPTTAYQWYMPELSVATLDERSREQARTISETAAAGLRERGLTVDSVVREGDARVEVVQEAADWNADLVVVGSHGHTGLRKLLLGSVAQYVVSHAPCSVEVARKRDETQGSPRDS